MIKLLIVTGHKEANNDIDDKLHAAGYTWHGGESLKSHRHEDETCRYLWEDGGKITVGFANCFSDLTGDNMPVYGAAFITPELVATFPNAKPLKPQGPFKKDGISYEIDGDSPRIPKKGEMRTDEDSNVWLTEIKFAHVKCWILRPLITAELQAAMDLEAESKKYVTEANRLSRHYKDLAKNTNITHKANIAKVEALKLKTPTP